MLHPNRDEPVVLPGKPYQLFEKKATSNTLAPRSGPDSCFPEEEYPNGRPIEPISIWRIYATSAGRARALTYFRKQGYKYFVKWIDVKGFGLQASYRAQWQDDNSAVSIQ